MYYIFPHFFSMMATSAFYSFGFPLNSAIELFEPVNGNDNRKSNPRMGQIFSKIRFHFILTK